MNSSFTSSRISGNYSNNYRTFTVTAWTELNFDVTLFGLPSEDVNVTDIRIDYIPTNGGSEKFNFTLDDNHTDGPTPICPGDGNGVFSKNLYGKIIFTPTEHFPTSRSWNKKYNGTYRLIMTFEHNGKISKLMGTIIFAVN